MSLQEMVQNFGASALTVTRHTAGSYVNGKWVPSSPSTLTIMGLIQPMNPREMQLLPEGLATKHVYKCYTAEELRTVDPTAKTDADKIVWNGRKFVVEQVDQWTGFGSSYYRSLLSEVSR